MTFATGEVLEFGALLLATGAEPIKLDIPGATLPHVHVLRTLADSRAIVAASKSASKVVVIGASFIGLEVAASLRQRGLDVTSWVPSASRSRASSGTKWARSFSAFTRARASASASGESR